MRRLSTVGCKVGVVTRTTSSPDNPHRHAAADEREPWPALFALCIGFFMILVDTTIVSVATPAIIENLHAEVNSVVWVTSAYLLAYAVPVLITGRLGDRFGPKRLYLTGLTVFTLASLWCGLTSTIDMLIAARVVQGIGASMMTPQTMAVITRIFPAQRRGAAMALWGATAGVATLVGPILGGVLVDALGWEWIFFINVPVGLIGFVAAWRLVPRLETHSHKFDWLGVVLSGAGMFLLVFGIQEGHQQHWSATIWSMIVAGLVVFALFVAWQARNRQEPLVPLRLFRDRNFSLANVAITTMGFSITAMAIPVMIWAQVVRGRTPTEAALLLVPMALMTLLLARVVGRLTDRVHPRLITGTGFALLVVGLVWLTRVMTPDTSLWWTVPPMVVFGIGNASVWAPTSATATRNLPVQLAGAGSGIYNATRLVGAVIGSAAIAVLMDSRLAAEGLPSFQGEGSGSTGALPAAVADSFSHAMATSVLITPAILVIGLIAALSFERPRHAGFAPAGAGSPQVSAAAPQAD
jgi:EmrB/QacA subfamily drug resistance transporter